MRRVLTFLAVVAIFAICAVAQSSPTLPNTPANIPVPEVRVPQPITVDPPSAKSTVAELEASADKLREQNMYRDAVDYYDVALKKEPKNAVLWNKRGIALLQLGRYKEGEKSFHKAIHCDKKYADAYNNLGVIYYKEAATRAEKNGRKDYGRAISTYKKALKLRDDSASFHSNLGSALFNQGEFHQAAFEYQRALQLDPDIFERTSRTGVAAHLASPEDRAHFAYVLAKMYAQAGNKDRALYYLRRALEDGYKDVNNAFKDSEFATVRKDPRFNELMTVNRPASVSVPE
jgi:tetratricopeptide (TPR) repeat protein